MVMSEHNGRGLEPIFVIGYPGPLGGACTELFHIIMKPFAYLLPDTFQTMRIKKGHKAFIWEISKERIQTGIKMIYKGNYRQTYMDIGQP